jgi:hypothetical protein
MSFFKLYEYASAKADQALGSPDEAGLPAPLPQDRCPVEVRDLQAEIISLDVVLEIKVHAVVLDPEINLGHIKIEDRREARYDDPELYAHIRFHEDQTRCWVRFVVCKELMHTFDAEDERVFNPERFRILLQQLETPPVAGQESPVYTSEWDAEWMALLVLCPYHHRNKWKAMLEAGEVTEMDVATQFRIPKLVIAALVSEQYDEAYNLLIVKAHADAANDGGVRDPNEPIQAA